MEGSSHNEHCANHSGAGAGAPDTTGPQRPFSGGGQYPTPLRGREAVFSDRGRGLVSVPEWFLTLCQKRLSLSAVRVGLALFGAGTRAVDTAGSPIIHGQLSLSELQRLTTLSRKSVVNGLEELTDLVGLVRHPATNAKAACGYALPLVKKVDQPQAVTSVKSTPADIATSVKSTPVPPILTSAKSTPSVGGEGGGVEEVVVDGDPSTTTGLLRGTTGEESTPAPPGSGEGDALLADLAELGAADPPEFLGKFPLERVQAWVAWIQQQPQGRFKNPAGFIFRKLEEGKEPPAAPDPARVFTRSKYGHVYRH